MYILFYLLSAIPTTPADHSIYSSDTVHAVLHTTLTSSTAPYKPLTSRVVTDLRSIAATSLPTTAMDSSSKFSLKMSTMIRSLSPEQSSTTIQLQSLTQISLTQTSATHTSVARTSIVTSATQFTTLFSTSSRYTPQPSTRPYSTILSSQLVSSQRLSSTLTSTHTVITTQPPAISTLITSATPVESSFSAVSISPSLTSLLYKTTLLRSRASSRETTLATVMLTSSLTSLSPTSSKAEINSDVIITSSVSVHGTEVQPSITATVFHSSTASAVTSQNIPGTVSNGSSSVSVTTSITDTLESTVLLTTTATATLEPIVEDVTDVSIYTSQPCMH